MPVVPYWAAVWMLPGMILLIFTKASTPMWNSLWCCHLGFCSEAAKWLLIVLMVPAVFLHMHTAAYCLFLKIFVCRFYVQGWGVMYLLELFLWLNLISASSLSLLCCALLQPCCAYQLYFWHKCIPWILIKDSSTYWCSRETTPLC